MCYYREIEKEQRMSKNRRRPHRGRREKKKESRYVIKYHPDRGTGCIFVFQPFNL